MSGMLRIVVCGSVDDGKSTLIGRLLAETGQVPKDTLRALDEDSKRHGTRGGAPDYALLLDGLEAEREQGITIDCAYRHFSTGRRLFIVQDAPGHEQYTRNMATAASSADAALIVVDAHKGPNEQTLRHARIVALMGVRDVVLAVNKMDLVGWDQVAYASVVEAFRRFAAPLRFASLTPVAVCATGGENVARASGPWCAGPALLECLESLEPGAEADTGFRLSVQMVLRHRHDFRGLAGRVSGGRVTLGERVRIVPGGRESSVRMILAPNGEVQSAPPGTSVTLLLDDDVDVGRGHVVAATGVPLECADQFEAHLIWLGEAPLWPGRTYELKSHTASVSATVTEIKHLIDPVTGARLAAREVGANAIAVVNLASGSALPFMPYADDRRLGAFILIDRVTCDTVGAGMLDFALRRAANLHRQTIMVEPLARAAQKRQRARCIWLTGLSGAGKSTLANALETRLFATGRHSFVLDGDNLRHGLNRDLGFTEAARVENIRRVAEVARLMVEAGLIVIVAMISPFRAERDFARSLFAKGEFIEVFVDATLAECERRDPKGLYAKARRGELKNFTGIDSAYEPPVTPDLRIDSNSGSMEAAAIALIRDFDL